MASKRSAKPASGELIPKQPVRGIGQQPVAQTPPGYGEFLEDLKSRIRTAQIKAALAVNREMVLLYWDMGRRILEQQATQGWGAKVIERLATDLHSAFPDMEGLSARNLKYMRAFAQVYQGGSIVQQAVAQIPWGHNIVLLQKLKDTRHRLWYAQQAVQNGWSRSMLLHWIESDLYARHGKAVTNFPATLPPPQSDLAAEVVKDPYSFDFLTLRADAAERELEQGLINHIRRFLLEMGAGFAFVGQQVHLEVAGEDYYLDLLFYHLRLRCYIVIDLKARPFKPEYAGKMNFYLSAVDELLRHSDDKPSIGLILCKTRNKVIAEYALRDVAKPVGVARYVTKLVEKLPAALKKSLPSPKELEKELGHGGNR